MQDKLLEELGPVVRSYYDNAGVGLERTCKEIISLTQQYLQSSALTGAKNIVELNQDNVSTFRFAAGNWLLVEDNGIIRSFRGDSPIGVTEIDRIVWRDVVYFSMPVVTVKELFEKGNRVYLVKAM